MAQDSHAQHAHEHSDDHAHLDDHHHEGPIAHTEVVPEKSAEDSFLLGILTVCFIVLLATMANWAVNVHMDEHNSEGVEHEQTFSTHGNSAAPAHDALHGTVPPGAHEVAPGPEGAPVAPTTTEGVPVAPNGNVPVIEDPHGTPGSVPAGTAVAPGAAPGTTNAPGTGAATGANTAPAATVAPVAPATPEWTGTQPKGAAAPAWTGTQPPAQAPGTPATKEANH
ncbi:MAG: hypothetical protein SGJ27_11200 [Candidatus Melainabacteria bacterium]|nr:hypothetical protein [Candidatus Melainabacteria bacterium]